MRKPILKTACRVVLGLFMFSLIATACNNKTEEKKEEKKDTTVVVPVDTTKLKDRPVDEGD